MEIERPVDTTVSTDSRANLDSNSLRYRIRDEQVEGLIINADGDIVKTIPSSDLLELMRQNSTPTLGNFLSVKV